MECLNSNGASAGWHSRRTINSASSPGTHTTPGDSSGGSRRMSLEFLRSYSNAPSPVQPGGLSRRARISDPGTYERVLDETGSGGGEMGSIAEGVERGERNAASSLGRSIAAWSVPRVGGTADAGARGAGAREGARARGRGDGRGEGTGRDGAGGDGMRQDRLPIHRRRGGLRQRDCPGARQGARRRRPVTYDETHGRLTLATN